MNKEKNIDNNSFSKMKNNIMYLNSNLILYLNGKDVIWVKESLIKKYLNMEDGVGRAQKRRLCILLNSNMMKNEDGVIYRKFTIYDILFCFRDDLINGKLDHDFNFMRVLGGE